MVRNITHYTDAVQRVVSVKLKHLFVFITYFIISNNYRSLFADSANLIDLNTDANLINKAFIELADNICNYLLLGHSEDEIIEMLNDDQEPQYKTNIEKINIKKLVTHIQSLLDKKYSKNNVINIFVDNKESENFYTQKKLWAKIKNTYFVLKSTAVLVIIAVVFYLLYLLAEWLKFKIPWFEHKKPQTVDDGPGTDHNSSHGTSSSGNGGFKYGSGGDSSKFPANGKIPNTSKSLLAQTQEKTAQSGREKIDAVGTHPGELQQSCGQFEHQKKDAQSTNAQQIREEIAGQEKQSHDTVEIDTQQPHKSNMGSLTPETQESNQSGHGEQVGTVFDTSCLPNDEIVDIDMLDFRLSRLIAEQIEQAKKVGLETKIIQSITTEKSSPPGDYFPVSVRLLQQVEYAKSIGLIP